ncbi:Cof-like hydrolase [Syntrophobotulus glycolicus DSM 8271]|uniref:Cof-like hydrolase n=1 Tax=Syntrophobotulus glycolicus (strain DSM 8271 / FlGlyR) TaxID=645991 RepID=F0T1R1_SYNGF|nr:Cof-type HAD-IIB family hydrolase [Syntrophobotulus glycolicus]ADY57485.1 Cof-like hydrolase [Syntrophobotulus glycolicus DSM 8271]
MIKLIAIDMDETLLNHDWKISRRNVEAIRQAAAQGVRVTLATGRMAASCRKFAKELGLDVPVITYHGALVEEALSGEVLYRKVIPISLAEPIIRELLDRKVHTQVYVKDRVFVNQANEYSDYYRRMSGVNVEETDVFALMKEEKEGFEKILLIGREKEIAELTGELTSRYAQSLHFTSSRPIYLDLLNKSVNKGTAIKDLADQLGIRREEVMAIGDSWNDREMIEYAGIGVAMGNAREEIKEIADYITDSNAEDGVAKAIENLVLAQEIKQEQN